MDNGQIKVSRLSCDSTNMRDGPQRAASGIIPPSRLDEVKALAALE